MTTELRLTVAMLTFRRPDHLARGLPLVLAQARGLDRDLADLAALASSSGSSGSSPGTIAPDRADLRIRADVLVVDNDPHGSGRAVLDAQDDPLLRYAVEPTPGIASGRNRVLTECTERDLLVFIDDDERPEPHWLALLVRQWQLSGADAVGGKVGNDFEVEPDRWIMAGGYYGRRNMPTGTEIGVNATNNLLVDLRLVRRLGLTFDATLGLAGGEDTLFTRRLHRGGGRITWCQEAVVTERVPADRVTRRFVMTRALSHGNTLVVVSLRLAGSPLRRFAVRARSVAAGSARIAGGLARILLGIVRRDLGSRSRGVRSICRGTGMLAAACGVRYREYAARRAPTAGQDRK